MNAFKKGDRVHWLSDTGKELHGTVVSAGKKSLKAIADGGKITANGPVECFEKSDRPAPAVSPSIMDKYSVRKYKYTGGEETPQFTAEIVLDGQRIAYASNAGRGGCNTYVGDGTAIKRLEAEAEAWSLDNGGTVYEPIDLWLDWYVNARAFGVAPKEYFSELKEA